jgi:hypothetical protein
MWIRISFNADLDPDPAFFVNADPDPGFFLTPWTEKKKFLDLLHKFFLIFSLF